MPYELQQHKTEGLIGSAVFHLLLLLIFFFFTFTASWNDEEGGGIAVNFGTSDEGWGDVQPQSSADASDVALDNQDRQMEAAAAPASPDNSKMLTSDDAESEAIKTKNNTATKDKTTPTPTTTIPKDQPKNGQDTKNSVSSNATPAHKVDENSLFKDKKNNSTSQGNTPGKSGDAGNPAGGAEAGNGQNGTNNNGGNSNGSNDGISKIDLANRSVKYKPQVVENSQEEGKVVIKIWVDQEGKVTRAEYVSAGSTTNNGLLRKAAIDAAKQTKFNSDPNAANLQTGAMTFNFRLK